jgi:hypothetical protein
VDFQPRVRSATGTVLSMPTTLSVGTGAELVGNVEHGVVPGVVAPVLVTSTAYLLTRNEQHLRPEPCAADPLPSTVGTP